ncbi:hypothetical protein [Flavobacterium macrobrachii]|uniref:Uncharacterized protein n=1 Tax=Flavobacterium macrobrachii TaxID=591204 RepID=A0ABS2CXB8_9FLAO|nr:hypothetical protein [Flavobacterium macrobrachii]MBM6499608.1 hypothetical protein [Flavobacterium macrobrachii]
MKLVVALAIFLLVLVSSYITLEDKKVEIENSEFKEKSIDENPGRTK